MSSENIETRERILKAALKLLEADPAGNVRMSDIARRAGISRQGLQAIAAKTICDRSDCHRFVVSDRALSSGSES